MKSKVSKETQAEAARLTKSTQKTALNKEQRKLIAQGIEKGIAEYKKQQKAKSRERDKAKKKPVKTESANVDVIETKKPSSDKYPWFLLGLSWLGFALYLLLTK